MSARQHHYISQFYLKGFTKGRSKKSKLTVIDFKERKRFETNPRNVGGIRDFNRIEIEGIDPNAFESMLSEFEGKAAKALKSVEETLTFDGDNKQIILNLIGLLALRTPLKREAWKNFEVSVIELMMEATLSSKKRYESQVRQMQNAGIKANYEVGYEAVKEFFNNKRYDIEIPTGRHLRTELVGFDAILPSLFDRKWALFKADAHSGPFITSDNPVSLTWLYPEKIPIMYRGSPGFGMNHTRVYFPLSNDLALMGEFDGIDGIYEVLKDEVAAFNSLILYSAHKQIYTPKIGFNFIKDEVILEGDQILKHLIY